MGPRVPFVSNPFGAISPNKVVETEKITEIHLGYLQLFQKGLS